MINKYQPHLLILPEDKADRQLANGFALHTAVDPRKIQVLPIAGGWGEALTSFAKNQQDALRCYAERRLVIVIDFDDRLDNRKSRLDHAKSKIPEDLRDRVFILGARNDPEHLKRVLSTIGSLEAIGTALAEDCRTGAHAIWNHPELAENADELRRLKTAVEPWLFY